MKLAGMRNEMRHLGDARLARAWSPAGYVASTGFGSIKQVHTGATCPTNHPARRLGVSPP